MASRSRRPWRQGDLLIRDADSGDARDLALKLADEDVAELYALSGLEPLPGMYKCLALSAECWVGVAREHGVVAIWGVVPTNDDTGANVWLACAPEVKKAPVAFSRIVREQMGLLRIKYGTLWAFSDSRAREHHRWLRRIGFTEDRIIEEFGYEQRPFHVFIQEETK